MLCLGGQDGTAGVQNWCEVCQDQERWSDVCAVAVDEVEQCSERINLLPTGHTS